MVSHTIDAPEVNADLLKNHVAVMKHEVRVELADVWFRDVEKLARTWKLAVSKRLQQPVPPGAWTRPRLEKSGHVCATTNPPSKIR